MIWHSPTCVSIKVTAVQDLLAKIQHKELDFGRVMVTQQQEYKCRQHRCPVLQCYYRKHVGGTEQQGYLIITFPSFDKLEQKDMRISNRAVKISLL